MNVTTTTGKSLSKNDIGDIRDMISRKPAPIVLIPMVFAPKSKSVLLYHKGSDVPVVAHIHESDGKPNTWLDSNTMRTLPNHEWAGWVHLSEVII